MAHDLLTRLPAVHAAMDAGALDEPRARVFSKWTADLHPEQACALCEELLPRAAGLTTGQLLEQIKKLAITVDPEWARRRYEQAVADRKVVGYRNPDGSANLSGCNLPVHRVAAASGHIDALAKAVKRAGDGRPIDHIRADLFLGMTDGGYSGLDDTEIINQLLAAADLGESGDPSDHHHDDARSGAAPSAPQGGPGRVAAGGAGMELRVRLSTLLGQDQYPAELAGWGPVHAELARDLAATLGGAEWRFAIIDEQGQLSHCGITRSRPTGTPRMAGCPAIVELAVPATTLRALRGRHTGLGAWAEVVADLLRQLEQDTGGDECCAGESYRRAAGAGLAVTWRSVTGPAP